MHTNFSEDLKLKNVVRLIISKDNTERRKSSESDYDIRHSSNSVFSENIWKYTANILNILNVLIDMFLSTYFYANFGISH